MSSNRGRRRHNILYTLYFYLCGTLILSLFALNGVLIEKASAILPTMMKAITATKIIMPYHIAKVSDYENHYSFPFEKITTYNAVSVESFRSFKIIDSTTTSESSQNKMQSLLTYENPVYGIRIKYPADWQREEARTLTPGKNITEVVRFTPNPHYTLSPKLFIQVEKLDSQNISLDQVTSQRLQRLENHGFTVVENDRISLPIGNIPADRVVSEGRLQHNDIKKIEIWIIEDDLVYTIVFSTEKGNYETHLPTVQKMIDSFEKPIQ
jgi:PsbP-like protein